MEALLVVSGYSLLQLASHGHFAENFHALGGGGMASLRIDPQGKAYGQMALEMPIAVPVSWLETTPAVDSTP